jgi:AcrR family transcriptional regulator
VKRVAVKPASRSRLGLTHGAIIEAARRLLDEHGVAGMTMRAVADQLGVGTMTLYGYFRDKDELLDAIVDDASAAVDLPATTASWKDDLRRLMLALHHQLTEHPFLVELRLRRPIIGRGAMRWTEAGLTILERAGLSPGEGAEAFRPLFIYTFGHAAFAPRQDGQGVVDRARAAVLSLPPQEYPRVTAAAPELAGLLVGREPYELGLDLLLDGLERRLEGG